VGQKRNDSDQSVIINRTSSSASAHARDESQRSRNSYQLKKITNSIAFFLCAGIAIFFLGKYTEYKSYSITYKEHHTARGEQSVVTLSDGSRVELHNEATLRYPEIFKGFKREVYLSGEAFFQVHKDSLRPFIIHSQEFRTLVTGSALGVKATPDNTTVTVAEGTVQVMAGDDMQIVLPDEKISYSHTTKKMAKAKADQTSL